MHVSTVTRFGLVLLASTFGAFGCAQREPRSPVAGLTNAVNPPKMPDLGRGAPRVETNTYYHIYLGEPVQRVCRGPSPFFDFDSAAATTEANPTISNLATCMNEGPLKGQSIRLIGHTDPRGSEKYNDKLGFERAERVKHSLTMRGIDAKRIEVFTAGEDDASDSPKDWPRDRRVEIQLTK